MVRYIEKLFYMKFFYVYKTTNKLNGKYYIGKHISNKETDDYLGSGLLLWRAINKYGIENFSKEIIEYCESSSVLNEREKYWIEKTDSLYPRGYNIAKGGNGGDLYTNNPRNKEIREKLRLLGLNQTKEHREALIMSRIGKKHTSEACKKISESRKGIIFTEEHKKNISEKTKEAMKNVKIYNRKSIDCFDKEGNFLQTTESIAEAARIYNQNNREICNMCKGKKHRIKDYIFSYHNK